MLRGLRFLIHLSATFVITDLVCLFRSSPGEVEPGSKEPPIDPALPRGPPETDQNIVPQLLIDHYVSMIDPSRVQTVESDIARHCAFSFPAVALTLGR